MAWTLATKETVKPCPLYQHAISLVARNIAFLGRVVEQLIPN